MEILIRDIGKSKGIIIPSVILKRYDLKDRVAISTEENGIFISKTKDLREGWEEASKQIAMSKESQVMPDFFEDEDNEDWSWDE